MGDGDQPLRALAEALPERSATPYSVTTYRTWERVVVTPAPSLSATVIRENLPSAAVEGRAMIGPPFLGQSGATDEIHLAADAAVHPVADRVGADLAREVHLDGGVDRGHAMQLPDEEVSFV